MFFVGPLSGIRGRLRMFRLRREQRVPPRNYWRCHRAAGAALKAAELVDQALAIEQLDAAGNCPFECTFLETEKKDLKHLLLLEVFRHLGKRGSGLIGS